jgi:DNA processing protein
MEINKVTLSDPDYPDMLRHIPSPPKQLFIAGKQLPDILKRPRVAIVGSRKVSAYGREVTTRLARALAERGVVIISGLAFGVDALAHRAALEAGGTTVAVLPGPVESICPASHTQLAHQITTNDGLLVSEYAAGSDVHIVNFIARNRLVSGLSEVLVITEAAEKSGSLHTARFALEQGRDVMAVPGSIFSPTSVGTNNLIKAGAMPVTDYTDVLHALGLEELPLQAAATPPQGDTPQEQLLLDLLAQGPRDGDALLAASGLDVARFNQTLTMLEITGKARSLGGRQWALG